MSDALGRFCRTQFAATDIIRRAQGDATPTFAIVNAEDEVAPPASIAPFIEAIPTDDARLVVFPPEVGVCLQHVSVLVGRKTRERIRPDMVSWLRSHGRAALPAAANHEVADDKGRLGLRRAAEAGKIRQWECESLQ